jgi:PAS domain-containing protein
MSPLDCTMEWESTSKTQLLDYLKRLEHRITELKEREQIWKPTALIDLLLEMIASPIILLDYSGDIAALNIQAAVVLGSTKEALIGKNLFDCVANPDPYKQNFESALASRSRVEFHDYTDGVPQHCRYYPIVDETNTIHGLVLRLAEV